MKPWLTLNLGVRYDIFTPYTDLDGYLSNFDFDGTNAMMVSPYLLGAQHAVQRQVFSYFLFEDEGVGAAL